MLYLLLYYIYVTDILPYFILIYFFKIFLQNICFATFQRKMLYFLLNSIYLTATITYYFLIMFLFFM